jgi:fatty-acyl-CoA synthase
VGRPPQWAVLRADQHHLTAAEAAYIIDNSAAKAIVGTAAMRPVLEGLASTCPGIAAALDHCRRSRIVGDRHLQRPGRLAALPECVADQPVTPIDDEIEGDLLQYSSGTTGRPKGIKRSCRIRRRRGARADDHAGVVLDEPRRGLSQPAPLYHTAPSVWSLTMQAAGIPVVVMEKFDAEEH